MRKHLRGFWLFLLFVALLAASPPPSLGPVFPSAPALASSSSEIMAVIHQAGSYDVAAATRIVRHWNSRKPGQAGDAALVPVPLGLAIPSQGSAAHGGEFSEAAWPQPFRHFDSQAPPSAC